MIRLLPFAMTAFLLISACAGFGPRIGSAPVPVESRAQALLQAKVEGDWGRVYDLLWKPYRDARTKASFVNAPRNMTFHSFRIEQVAMVSETQATVSIHEVFSMQGFQLENPTDQTWVLEDGAWYFALEPEPAGGALFNTQGQ